VSVAGTRFLARFSRAERAVHWTLAALMITCILTAVVLYNGSLALLVGHRHVVELIHVYSGLALPVPLLAGAASVAYRADLRRLNRFSPYDWQWLRSRRARRAGTLPVGKFNAGQKVNAALSGGAILVLFGTGLLMFFTNLARLSWRTGATLVHDWFALAVGLLIAGHIWYALRDPDALTGMIRGRVPESWARTEHPAWVDPGTGLDERRPGEKYES
jgi:formate dehydrogenase subunit gamma